LLATTALLPATLAQAQAPAPNAAPTGGQVVAGAARITQGTRVTRIEQTSDRAVVDWQRFDVGRDHTVRFQQPGTGSWTLNRVNSPDPSLIAGRIAANGGVAIVNRSGVVFGQGSQVNVGSLIASAAGITTQNFMAGSMAFDQPAKPGARVENRGTVTVADRGLVALAGPGSANRGVIRARLGRVALAGAETFALDLAGDGMLALDVTGAVRQGAGGEVALVTNAGTIAAQGGSVLLTADAARGVVEALVRNTGSIAAEGGQVALRGAGGGTVEIAAGTVRGRDVAISSQGGTARIGAGARADASGRRRGGTVQVGGATTARTEIAGQALARGTGRGAQGGRVTAEARQRVAVQPGGRLDASGRAGGGTVLAGTTGVGRAQTMARETVVAAGARLVADATGSGRGGTIAVNSTTRTDMRGAISARGVASGGFVEVSGQGALVAPGLLGAVDVGASAGPAGTLLIDPTSIVIAAAGDAVAGDVAAGDAPATLTLDAASVSAFAGDLLLEATRAIDVNAAVTKPDGDLTLRTTTGTGTSITLAAPVTLGTGTLALEGGNGIAIGGAVSAPEVVLTATKGDITQTAPITAGTLLVQADTLAGQAVVLDHASNAAGTIAGRSTGGFAYTDADALTVGTAGGVAGIAASQSASGITLRTGGTLDIAGAVQAGGAGTVSLTANAGDITQSAAITGQALHVEAYGTDGQRVVLDHAGNDVVTLAGRARGEFRYTDASALTIGTVGNAAGVIVADAGAGIALTAAGTITVEAPVVTAEGGGGAVSVTATGGAIRNDSAIIAAGSLAVRGATGVANRTAGAWMLAETGALDVEATTGAVENAGQMLAAGNAAGSRVAAAGALVNDGLIALWDGSGAAVAAVTSGGAMSQSIDARMLAGTITAGGALSNAGQIGADALTAANLTNTADGLLGVRGAATAGALTNAGDIAAGSVATTGALSNTGTLRVVGAATAGGGIVNEGALAAETLRATTGGITNTARLQADTVRAATRIRNEGTAAVLRAGQVTADTADVVNIDGADLLAGGRGAADPLTLDVAGLPDAAGARAAALGSPASGEGQLSREISQPEAAPATFGVSGGPVPQASGDGAEGALRVTATAGRVLNQDGAAIIAGTTLDIAAAGEVQNSGAGSWMLAEAGRLTVAGAEILNSGQIIAADGTQAGSAVTAIGSLSNSGIIVLWDGGGAARGVVAAGTLTNGADGRILAGQVGQDGAGLTNAGRIAADSLLAAALTNTGWIATRGAILAASLANGGEVLAGSVTTTGALSNTGTLRSAGAVLAGGDLTHGGVLVAPSVRASGALTTTGSLQAETVAAGSTLRAGGTLRAAHVTAGGGIEVIAGAEVLAGSTSPGAAVTHQVSGVPGAAAASAAARAGTAPGTVTLAASGGAVAQPEGTPASGDLTLRAPSVRIAGLVQAHGELAALGDTLTASGSGRLEAGGTLRLGPLTLGREVQFGGDGPVAGRLVIGADVLARIAGATVLVDGGTTSAILLTGAADLAAQGIAAVAVQGATIEGAATLSATQTLTLSAATRVSLTGGTYAADRMRALAGPAGDATGSIALSDIEFRIGTGLLLAGGGGIAMTGATSVAGTQPGIDPLVILETRRSATALRDLPTALTAATADQRGTVANAQAWQVANPRNPGRLVFGRDDGSGAATRAAGGAVTLNLDAGTAPVFLLLDAGTATGTLEAGRLGVLGLPGGGRAGGDRVVDLEGRLGGLDGTPAAQFGRSSTVAAGDQTLYRINNCVLDTVTCVAVSFVQPVAAPLRNTIDIRPDVPRIDPDVLVPNIAEEDY
jgi:filamentous hemagglutinin family protein